MLLSVKIMLYNFFLRAFVPYVLIPANKVKFGITPDQVTNLGESLTDFTDNFDLYSDPETHDTPVINDMNVSYESCFLLTEGIRKQIKSNSTIVLSGLDRRMLNIPVPPPRRSHVKVPDIKPVVVCVFKTELLMKFIVFDPNNPFRKAKPPGVASIGVKVAITAAGAPAPGIKDYVVKTPENSTEFEMLFTADQVGKTFYIICYYLNARNEEGKDGLPYSVTII